ncbi:hypothetical protein TNCV_3117301 [Trichonephila clavipes]|nr:hypothetical protein TNCV_3117301 [Trichonephila clavipes]
MVTVAFSSKLKVFYRRDDLEIPLVSAVYEKPKISSEKALHAQLGIILLKSKPMVRERKGNITGQRITLTYLYVEWGVVT